MDPQQTTTIKTETTTVLPMSVLPDSVDSLRKLLIDQNVAIQSISRFIVSQAVKSVVDAVTMEAALDENFLGKVLVRLKGLPVPV